jgi:hypothetical protein
VRVPPTCQARLDGSVNPTDDDLNPHRGSKRASWEVCTATLHPQLSSSGTAHHSISISIISRTLHPPVSHIHQSLALPDKNFYQQNRSTGTPKGRPCAVPHRTPTQKINTKNQHYGERERQEERPQRPQKVDRVRIELKEGVITTTEEEAGVPRAGTCNAHHAL